MLLNEAFTRDSLTPQVVEDLTVKILSDMGKNNGMWFDDQIENIISILKLPQPVVDMICAENNCDFDGLDTKMIFSSDYAEKYILKYMKTEFLKTYDMLESSYGNGGYIYRVIDLDNLAHKYSLNHDLIIDNITKNPNKIHLGICWTNDYDSVWDFAENLNENILIFKAKINMQPIDIPETLILRNQFTDYYYENEIRLIRGAPIFVEEICQYNDSSKPSNIFTVQKMYKA